ncbi:DUF1648 domain-containing protein [Jonesia denitrificans]|uniref:DUF1648 domain-containing protein n=1 Tax=Jonesia denitrificans (strain ATCC 14870 / DSM 20603 / BCRC 15368 / CIP 55.134 / JCM 11481 / NBRC 15587 / NCTC 10816 / Prevot 55134) TaxID=471856 RepID=C7R1X4_JONDD|nr:DUF1648 domain-containing protein [Jonesia denitrificans]ACV08442.1 protein of unknown function DUF1648 [Jonesia denitrificans DSM 20603]ASE07912.1 DUF1648 domain-containing protein [Jonesia denitrificans]QXB42521.1 DUF1648 domain-containing protein [Jonesia denitrificans]SQH20421.1 Predicted membrane protein [Jonesia denitrificans]
MGNSGVNSSWRERQAHLREVMAEAKTLEREPAARWVTVVFGAATALWIVVVVWLALTLPDEVPIHWSSGGVPDGWASKTGALAFSILVPLATIFPLVFLSRLVLAAPDTLNSPHKEWWIAEPHRLIRCERLLREDLMVIVALTVVLLTTVDVLIGYAAHQPGGVVPSWWFTILLVAYVLALVGYTTWMYASARYRPTKPVPPTGK